MKRFALIGAAGYIAPRHLQAIRDTGGDLVAALDPSDSVGILDSHFPEAAFFTRPELFESHLHALRRQGRGVDYLSICSPNHLHGAHIELGLRAGADVICEKPVVLNPEEIRTLQAVEAETGRRVWTVLQLRVHRALGQLREQLAGGRGGGQRTVNLTYVTSRGQWYLHSWKGRPELSGGLATNIGVHFYDLLIWLFGDVRQIEVHERTDRVCAGHLELERARVTWFLSIDLQDVPEALRARGQRTYRSIVMDGQEVEFSEGFTDLHSEVYRRTLAGDGFGLDVAAPAIEAVAQIRTLPLAAFPGAVPHPFLQAMGRVRTSRHAES